MGLIIDVRQNGRGNGLYAQQLAKHLVEREYIVTESWKTRIHNAAKKAWKDGAFAENRAWEFNPPDTIPVGEDIKKITVPIVIIMGKSTYSAAEDFLIYTLGNENIKKIGQNSAGSSGQPLYFDLPGGITGRVCAKRDALPDGTDYIGIGVKPDIEVAEDGDVLEYAIKYLGRK